MSVANYIEALRAAREKAWDEGADAVSYDPDSRDLLTQPENPYRKTMNQ